MSRFAATTSSTGTKLLAFTSPTALSGFASRSASSGRRTRLGDTSEILTRANRSPPCGSLTTTARLKLRLEMCGKGWAGSKASGVSAGKISRAK